MMIINVLRFKQAPSFKVLTVKSIKYYKISKLFDPISQNANRSVRLDNQIFNLIFQMIPNRLSSITQDSGRLCVAVLFPH
jgi:hypothetical protein